MRRAWALLLLLGAASASCALIGYDLDGYGSKATSAASGGGGHGEAGSGGAADSSAASGGLVTWIEGTTGSASAASTGAGGPVNCTIYPFSQTTYGDVPVGAPPYALHVVDINGDKKPDIVLVNPERRYLSRLFNGDGGVFIGEKSETFMQMEPTAVTAGDFGTGSLPDVVVTDRVSGSVYFLPHPGKDALSSVVPVASCQGLSDVVTDTFGEPGETLTDIAFTCEGGVFIASGQGNGQFTPAERVVTLPGSAAILAADLNNDARRDMVVITRSAGSEALVALLTTPTGIMPYVAKTFTESGVQRAVVGYYNQDTLPDIAVTVAKPPDGSGHLYLGAEVDVFDPMPHLLDFGYPTYGITTGDFNGDGVMDIAASGEKEVFVLLLGPGLNVINEQSLPGLKDGTTLKAADINGDGLLDLIEGSRTENKVRVFINSCAPPKP